MSAKAYNFASYKELAFDFTNQGLTLVQGPTGAGKSTLCDLIPWGLFGRTSKGGSVDEILSWPGDEVTKVTLFLGNVTIHRSRGPKAKDNDLFFSLADGVITRGKDLLDTQKLINSQLGFDYDLYMAGAYFHEFSQTAQFFTATAKSRRLICEQLVDLSLPKKLSTKISENIKNSKAIVETGNRKIHAAEVSIDTLRRVQRSEDNRASTWNLANEQAKVQIARNYAAFEGNRKKIVSKKCNSCGTVLQKPKEIIDDSVNPYIQRLLDLEVSVNPYAGNAKDYSDEIKANEADLSILKGTTNLALEEIADLELLQQVSNDFRSLAIENSIKYLEINTNQLLMDYFDAEIKVNFEIEDTDKLEVTLLKDGNLASYTQLSKGQRCLLKLCFGTSVMKAVSNHHGVSFSQVFYDESLDGLSDEFKVKAYRLFETIAQEHESVFVVEHSSELKAMFPNSYNVELVNGSSVIAKA